MSKFNETLHGSYIAGLITGVCCAMSFGALGVIIYRLLH